jgi:Xaa-Pro dipeptidase
MIKRDLPFSMEEYQSRVDKVRAAMAERGLDVLLLVSPVSCNYLTGSLKGVEYLILPLKRELTTFSWELEMPLVMFSSWVEDTAMYRTGEDPLVVLRRALDERDLLEGIVGIECDTPYISVDSYRKLIETFKDVKVVDGSGIIGGLIRIKSPQEIAYIRKAGILSGIAMGAAVDAAEAGATDAEVAAAGHKAAIAAGSETLAGQPIVTVGPRSGIAHTRHMRRVIEPGDPVWIELTGTYHRYSAPIMRTVFIGSPPEGAQALADASMACLETVLTTMRPGVTAHQVAEAGAADLPLDDPEIGFHDTYGYSIGLGFEGWADTPDWKIKLGDPTVLETGMVFHVTMGLRRNFKYGAVCSETATITEDGCEVLTSFPRQYFYK